MMRLQRGHLHAEDEGFQVVLGPCGLSPCSICCVQFVQHCLAGLHSQVRSTLVALSLGQMAAEYLSCELGSQILQLCHALSHTLPEHALCS